MIRIHVLFYRSLFAVHSCAYYYISDFILLKQWNASLGMCVRARARASLRIK